MFYGLEGILDFDGNSIGGHNTSKPLMLGALHNRNSVPIKQAFGLGGGNRGCQRQRIATIILKANLE